MFTTNTPAKCNRCPKNTTARFVLASGGLCPSCLKASQAVPRICSACQRSYLWHTRFAAVVGHPSSPQRICPKCADLEKRQSDEEQPVVIDRKALLDLPSVRIDIDFEAAVLCDPERKAAKGRNPARRIVLKDAHGKLYDGRCDFYDYRADGCRGHGSLARLRVMEVTHDRARTLTVESGTVLGAKQEETLTFDATYQYVVLEPVGSTLAMPVARLIAVPYAFKTAAKGGKSASGGVTMDRALWSRHLTSNSRSLAHGGGTVVAVVDNLHALSVRQDHLEMRYDLDGDLPNEEGFRAPCGTVSPSVFVPGADTDLLERCREQGFPAKIAGDATFIGLNKSDAGWSMPEGLPETFLLRLEAAEAGGGLTSTGHSVVVCSERGERLRPFATSGHRGFQACGTHAWFARTGAIVTVSASYWSKQDPPRIVTITLHTVEVDGYVATVRSEVLFTGTPTQLPYRLNAFRAAVEAAGSKAADYHCRTVHYSL